MLYNNIVTPHTAVKLITGRQVARMARNGSAHQRAALAAQLYEGDVELVQPTAAQAQKLCNSHQSYFDVARRATPELRQEIVAGEESLFGKYITDEVLDRLARLDAERLWAALDRAEHNKQEIEEFASA
jgi:hypothetical protein